MVAGLIRRAAWWLALLAIVALNTALALHFEPPSLVLDHVGPAGNLDWEIHYGQVQDAVEAHRQAGQAWAYDPQRFAGQPTGIIFDVNNKGWEAWTIGLQALGVPMHVAFNLFIWLLSLSVPLVVWAAARLFGLSRGAAVIAAALGCALFHFDALSHWCTWVGMVAWAGAAYVWLLPLAMFWHWCRTRAWWALGALLPLLALVLHLHPYAFFALVVPMGVILYRARRSLERKHALGLGLVVVATLAANWWWLAPTVRFWHYALNSGYFLDAKPSFLLTDYLGLLKDPSVTGVIGMRAAFRYLGLGAAAACLWLWRKERDERAAPFAAALGTLLLVAYFGGLLSWTRQVQPYRLVLPAIYLAVIPAAHFLERATLTLARTRLPAAVWALFGVALFVLVPRFVRDVLYFLPAALPKAPRAMPPSPADIDGGIYFGTIRWPTPFDFRHRAGTFPDLNRMAAYVDATDDGSGRWLIESWTLGERLSWATKAQIIGGFVQINLAHSDANLFRRAPVATELSTAELRDYLERYNVKWIVIDTPQPHPERLAELAQLEASIDRSHVYRVLAPPGFVVGDAPAVVKAQLNQLQVRGSAGGSLVLRYHWLETLRCRPNCQVRRVDLPDDRVGFVGVDNAPADFEIYNGY